MINEISIIFKKINNRIKQPARLNPIPRDKLIF